VVHSTDGGRAHRCAPLSIGGRFAPVRLLRRAPGVDTFLAADLAGGGEVVLKSIAGDALAPAIAAGRDSAGFYVARRFARDGKLRGN
jgi:hypothetical protein